MCEGQPARRTALVENPSCLRTSLPSSSGWVCLTPPAGVSTFFFPCTPAAGPPVTPVCQTPEDSGQQPSLDSFVWDEYSWEVNHLVSWWDMNNLQKRKRGSYPSQSLTIMFHQCITLTDLSDTVTELYPIFCTPLHSFLHIHAQYVQHHLYIVPIFLYCIYFACFIRFFISYNGNCTNHQDKILVCASTLHIQFV